MRGEVFPLRWLEHEWWKLRAHAMDMAKSLGDFSFFCIDERGIVRAQRVCAPGSEHTRIIIFWTLCRERRAFFLLRRGCWLRESRSANELCELCAVPSRFYDVALAHSVQHHTRARSLSQCAQHKVCWNNCNLKCKESQAKPFSS
jgi:hypothetical protein